VVLQAIRKMIFSNLQKIIIWSST